MKQRDGCKKACMVQCFINADQMEIVEKVKKNLGNKDGKGCNTK